MYGEQVAEVVAKACFEPSALSNAELFILDRYFSNRVIRVFQMFWQSNFMDEPTWDWRATASLWLKTILSFPQEESYLQGNLDIADTPELGKLVRSVIAEGNYPSCRDVIGRLRIEG